MFGDDDMQLKGFDNAESTIIDYILDLVKKYYCSNMEIKRLLLLFK